MAKKKKSRTPAPPRSRSRPSTQSTTTTPRQVQAPQVRTKRRTQEDVDRRNRYILYAIAASGIIGVAAALIAIFALGGGGKKSGGGLDLRHTKAPWPIQTDKLEQRLSPLGLHALSQEGAVIHTHSHLDIFVNRKHISVPKFIGIDDNKFITELHTHAADGIIHVESPTDTTFTLGQFISEWGVFMTRNALGGYVGTTSKPLGFYLNGKPYNGDPAKLVLKDHQEIAIVYGKPPKKIPASYDWAQKGL